MKKILMLLLAALMAALFFCPAFGEAALGEVADPDNPTIPTAPAPVLAEDVPTQPPEAAGYDWGYLGTIAGATAAVLLIVQYTKDGIDRIKHIPTRLYVYILALLILLGARALGTGVSWPDVPLVALNAVVVATAAMGSYELTWAKRE